MYSYRVETLSDSVKRVLLNLDTRFSSRLTARSSEPIPIPSFLSSVIQGKPLAIVGTEMSLDRLVLNMMARINRLPLDSLMSGLFDPDWWQPLCNSAEIIKAAMPSKMIIVLCDQHRSDSIPTLDPSIEGIVIDSTLNVRFLEKHLQTKNGMPMVARSFLPKTATSHWNQPGRVNYG